MHYFHITETGSGKGSTLTTRKHRHTAFERAAEIAKESGKPVAVWNAQALIWERTYFPTGLYNIGYDELEPCPHPVKRRRATNSADGYTNPDAHHTPESAIMAQEMENFRASIFDTIRDRED